MAKKKVIHVGTLEFDYKRLTADQGHEYGKGRGVKVHKHKTVKREKQRLRRELREW